MFCCRAKMFLIIFWIPSSFALRMYLAFDMSSCSIRWPTPSNTNLWRWRFNMRIVRETNCNLLSRSSRKCGWSEVITFANLSVQVSNVRIGLRGFHINGVVALSKDKPMPSKHVKKNRFTWRRARSRWCATLHRMSTLMVWRMTSESWSYVWCRAWNRLMKYGEICCIHWD